MLLSLSPPVFICHPVSMKQVVLIALGMSVVSCGSETEERLTTGDRTYLIPSQHISTVTREPHIFVRIKHPERQYDLIYDSRSQGRTDPQGAPVVFSINDGQSPGLVYFRSRAGMIVCRRAANPRGGCGLKLTHGKNEWSLVFPENLLNESAQFVRDASAQLQRYDKASR